MNKIDKEDDLFAGINTVRESLLPMKDGLRPSTESEPIDMEIPDFGELLDSTLSRLDTLQKLKILMTFMNYFTKVWAIYLIIMEYETFS